MFDMPSWKFMESVVNMNISCMTLCRDCIFKCINQLLYTDYPIAHLEVIISIMNPPALHIIASVVFTAGCMVTAAECVAITSKLLNFKL